MSCQRSAEIAEDVSDPVNADQAPEKRMAFITMQGSNPESLRLL